MEGDGCLVELAQGGGVCGAKLFQVLRSLSSELSAWCESCRWILGTDSGNNLSLEVSLLTRGLWQDSACVEDANPNAIKEIRSA